MAAVPGGEGDTFDIPNTRSPTQKNGTEVPQLEIPRPRIFRQKLFVRGPQLSCTRTSMLWLGGPTPARPRVRIVSVVKIVARSEKRAPFGFLSAKESCHMTRKPLSGPPVCS